MSIPGFFLASFTEENMALARREEEVIAVFQTVFGKANLGLVPASKDRRIVKRGSNCPK